MKTSYIALAALLAPALPAQAQTAMDAFNPMAMLAPIMTPLGAMMVPMMAPMNSSMNMFNPATMYNPATMFNPAAMANPTAMMPAMPSMPAMPGYGAPAGMVPFTGMQLSPQSYGMPPQMANPFAAPQMANPFAMPQMSNPFAAPQMANPFGNAMMPFSMPNQAGFPAFPGFPMMLPPTR